jgi:hypothetical protein
LPERLYVAETMGHYDESAMASEARENCAGLIRVREIETEPPPKQDRHGRHISEGQDQWSTDSPAYMVYEDLAHKCLSMASRKAKAQQTLVLE